ncbi:MAG: VWA domain-containing protein [Pirellulales bacterium]
MPSTTPISLLAFGFGNLAMLGWLAAAAAPLLIHLWSRRKFRETSWAAMTFLLAAMRRSARRILLQQWLLLAVRTLIIVLVVLAVAEPYGSGSLAGGPAGAPAHKVIVIDGSYSMAYRDGDASHFSRAKQLAAQLVRDSGPADTFTVIVMAQPARTILGRDVVDHAAVASQIESLTQTHTGADLAQALTLVAESLDDQAGRQNTIDRHEVYFFTDVQQATWNFNTVSGSHAPRGNRLPGRSGGPELPVATQSIEESRSHALRGNEGGAAQFALRERITALAKRAAIVIVDMAPSAAANLAVTQLAIADPYVNTGSDTTIEATLHQFGDQPRSNCVVELLVDGVPVAEQTLDVPAESDAAVRFSHRFRTPGEHTIAVRAAGDPLEVDSTRWLVAPVRDAIRVLCVAGKPGEAKYLADALDPDPTDASPIQPTVVAEVDLAELELGDFDCIFLCNVAQLTAGEAERFARYAAAGGGVVIFLGDRVEAESYNAAAEKLLPARIGQIVVEQQFGLDPLDYRHPIIAPFRGRERAGLLTTPVARHYRLESLPDRAGVEVAAALPGGDPFLVTAPLGRGRVVLVATDGSLASVEPASGEPWTAWPTWPSFLPMVREMLAFAVGGQSGARQQMVGTPLGGSGVVEEGSSGVVQKEKNYSTTPLLHYSTISITRPDGGADAVGVENGQDGGQWSYNATDLSGVYTVRGASAAPPQPFAVNVETTESDLSKADPQHLPPDVLLRATPQAAASLAANDLLPRAGWQRSLLTAALALLLVESLLAWHFGRGVT